MKARFRCLPLEVTPRVLHSCSSSLQSPVHIANPSHPCCCMNIVYANFCF